MNNNLYDHYFQPIMDIHKWRVLGYESLLRSKYIKNPESLFSTAININKLFELDISSLAKSIHSFNSKISKYTSDELLFVNVYPSTLISPNFQNILMTEMKKTLISPNQIVIEINESEIIESISILREAVVKLKSLGFKIALDDFDKGIAPFKKILELEPDYIKLDRYFAKNLANMKRKQKALQYLLIYSSSNKMEIILEGIELKADLTIAKSLGVVYGQGYLIGKPDKLNKNI